MSLDTLLSTGPATATSGSRCVIGLALDGLPKKYSKALTEQLAHRWAAGGDTDYDIASRMQQAGLKASPTSVNRHRNGRCTCPKEGQ